MAGGWRPVVMPTRLDELRRRYAHGLIDIDEFEARRDAMYADRTAHDPMPDVGFLPASDPSQGGRHPAG